MSTGMTNPNPNSEPESDARTSTHISPARIRSYTSPRTHKDKQIILMKSHPHPDPTIPISILNYTNDAEWTRSWDDLTMAARVLVVEKHTGKVVSRAFSKFFNWNEKNAYKPWPTGDGEGADEGGRGQGEAVAVQAKPTLIQIEEKLDGSIISLFWYANQWIMTSKARYDSVHVKLAWEVLIEKYRMIIHPNPNSPNSNTLSKEKTYVFELIHPKNPTHVRYDYKDLVLLSVFDKDGSEPPPEFDWSVYPFPRPAVHDVSRIIDVDGGAAELDLEAVHKLRKLNRVNEEGFVLKFFLPNSLHPQRMKVKFESYLDLIKSKDFHSPTELAELYAKKRESVHSFDEAEVERRMAREKRVYIASLRRIADDFGGEKWVGDVTQMWDQVDNVFVREEKELRRVLEVLIGEGFGEVVGTKDGQDKRRFATRIMRDEGMAKHKSVLFAWIGGVSLESQVKAFVQSVRVKDIIYAAG